MTIEVWIIANKTVVKKNGIEPLHSDRDALKKEKTFTFYVVIIINLFFIIKIIIIISIIIITLLIPQTVKKKNRINDLVCTVRSQ